MQDCYPSIMLFSLGSMPTPSNHLLSGGNEASVRGTDTGDAIPNYI